jgi:hypothetical protein
MPLSAAPQATAQLESTMLFKSKDASLPMMEVSVSSADADGRTAAAAAPATGFFRDTSAALYSLFSRFCELMTGGTLAYLILHKQHYLPQKSNGWPITGLLLIAAAIMLFDKNDNHMSAQGAILFEHDITGLL